MYENQTCKFVMESPELTTKQFKGEVWLNVVF